MDVLNYIRKRAGMVNQEIDRLIPEDTEPPKLADAYRHLILAGGKRLRPVLTLTAAEAVGGDSEKVIESAAAIEVLHTFTLIHDDMMDRDDFRRGAETVHKVWNEPLALISGDALFAKVFEALASNARRENLSSGKILQLFDSVSKASFRVCQGQA